MNITTFAATMNRWGQEKVPFLFVVDFEMQQPLLIRLQDVDATTLLYRIQGITNATPQSLPAGSVMLEKIPPTPQEYQRKFAAVYAHLAYGDSFLTNLTVKTEVKTDRSLRDLFYLSRARYKLLFDNRFLVFSPEIFVQIKDKKIYSFPMKGTMDAALPQARERLLADPKEIAEHVTIVDLIRNDLSQVASGVHVSRFRYIEEIQTASKTLLQVSSEVVGDLEEDYAARIGDILVRLLPPGSVSGAPKPKTLEIIRDVEQEQRGYYTGVFGVFDGERLDSGVMIRFIEKQGDRYFYRSGGGITTQSTAASEYQEVIDKVYVPLT
ncbi:MAG TPA: aminodeoxychorismate synthase component I [Chryseolinea sp.]